MIVEINNLNQHINDQMIEIPSGNVDLRDDRTKQQWSVELSEFYLSKTPVTQDLYFEITQERPSTFIGEKKPVETVTWKDAIVFCNSLSHKLKLQPCYELSNNPTEVFFDSKAIGFRLPTEAEWQYACKAGTAGIRYDAIDEVAWYKANSEEATHNVGEKKPNPFGVYDMLGNVWEWTNDIYDETVYGSYRIIRGGGWCDHERSVMATTRRRSHPLTFKIDDLGFRIAKNSNQNSEHNICL